MALNISKGNMYEWLTHTWNTVKGKCPHGCTYCYMGKWKNQKPVRFDEKELKTDLGEGKFIFVGSSCDMFANDISDLWIEATLEHCKKYYSNSYLFQSKNPERFSDFIYPENTVFCTTIETNRFYLDVMESSPHPENRAMEMSKLSGHTTYVTIEPIMEFDLDELVSMIEHINPTQVNIGADSGGNKLPEPSPQKVEELIKELSTFTTVKRKSNLKRLCS